MGSVSTQAVVTANGTLCSFANMRTGSDSPDSARKAAASDRAGVLQLLKAKKEVLQISGPPSLRQALREHLAAGQASFFLFEEEEMYTQRESELLPSYLSRHGRLPPGNDLPEVLF